jgi:hypothetical protein
LFSPLIILKKIRKSFNPFDKKIKNDLTRLRLRRKIRKVPGVFLNLSLNLNLAILKMRIAAILFEKRQ